ncbi:hypothetical protein DB346_09700 [Verrucomicrobia bacterium LW23]|nr:hypothetical protein DB346_09700 [Verrucomicrobia bacterium LW23]
MEAGLLFMLQGFGCDDGSEFLNWHLVRYFRERALGKAVGFTRSRPYHKADNGHVEQKKAGLMGARCWATSAGKSPRCCACL